MTLSTLLFLGLCVLLFLSFQPFFIDPYYHKEKVSFWTWGLREVNELVSGEKE